MAKKKAPKKKSIVQQQEAFLENATYKDPFNTTLDFDLTTIPPRTDRVVEVVSDFFNYFQNETNMNTLVVKLENKMEVWNELKFFLSALYTWDVEHGSNHNDTFEKDVYYETITGEYEFVVEARGKTLLLTIIRF